jgi:hypothetical protein
MIDRDTIFEYPALDLEARRALESEVRADGRHVELLEEMIFLARMIDEARHRNIGLEELAYVAAQEHSEDLKSPFADSVKKIAAEDEKLSEELEAMRLRAGALIESHDPIAHFESLRSTSVDSGVAPETVRSARVGGDRAPVRRSRLRSVAGDWWSTAAALVVIALVGIFALALVSAESDVVRLGHFEMDEINPQRYLMTARSADSFSLTPTDSVMVQALHLLRESRSVRLGIFPRYDQKNLSDASALLSEVIARLPENDFLSLEARYLRAKARLLAEDPRAAIQDLEVLLQYEGTRNARARTLLTEVRAVLEDA